MTKTVRLGNRLVGDGHPVFITAEIGINHNGSVDLAKMLVDMARRAGCDAVKFQKRDPELCIPPEQRQVMRETPWGYISYVEYRHRIEFGREEYREIEAHCRKQGITWFASCWDTLSVDFMEEFDLPCYKIPSASLTNKELLGRVRATDRPLILSTGMSTMDQIKEAVGLLDTDKLIIAHSTSTYPCPPQELNLRMLATLRETFSCPIGYSGHEVGLPTTIAAVAMGACYVERHITLDRAMWGSDQAASVEPGGLERLIKYTRTLEQALGDGVKKVYPSEMAALKRLRRAE